MSETESSGPKDVLEGIFVSPEETVLYLRKREETARVKASTRSNLAWAEEETLDECMRRRKNLRTAEHSRRKIAQFVRILINSIPEKKSVPANSLKFLELKKLPLFEKISARLTGREKIVLRSELVEAATEAVAREIARTVHGFDPWGDAPVSPAAGKEVLPSEPTDVMDDDDVSDGTDVFVETDPREIDKLMRIIRTQVRPFFIEATHN